MQRAAALGLGQTPQRKARRLQAHLLEEHSTSKTKDGYANRIKRFRENCKPLNRRNVNSGVRIRGTLGDIDPLNKVPSKRARSRVQEGPLLRGLPKTLSPKPKPETLNTGSP